MTDQPTSPWDTVVAKRDWNVRATAFVVLEGSAPRCLSGEDDPDSPMEH